MAVRIICINKDYGNHYNPHEAISYYGWRNEQTGENGRASRAVMVDFLQNKRGVAYVGDGSQKAYCYVLVSPAGTKYLQTQTDGRWSNNLLNLPECR
ncbi:MAG: hypothetical protein JWO96_840 [Candidatus Saccharibacteria bacterium]|nr:hypothetical protein [Candidatus Saccharibacteria bacterium]